ncbi:helix-turn-helix transcriptional regulator [Xanthocytophaga agilis]|uniref:Helix-turn-helix transcriptional regulator n=1 Tax=Xanthocytophaga agilis TaxID=3048010 RepID=A0AAE3R4N8_9BACT|nr:helix-turn-helix transcriptional regulator [Xanthocytophaga agilis]MDJ1503571.1 helix-turn-helix transcriptional regulator [Xanthocytophaga agilis]
MNIGETIRQFRILKKLSHKDVAFQLGITQQAYSKIERDETRITVDRLSQIASVLDMDMYYILFPTKYESYQNLQSAILSGANRRMESIKSLSELNNSPTVLYDQEEDQTIESLQRKTLLRIIESQKKEIDSQKKEMELLKREKIILLETLKHLEAILPEK